MMTREAFEQEIKNSTETHEEGYWEREGRYYLELLWRRYTKDRDSHNFDDFLLYNIDNYETSKSLFWLRKPKTKARRLYDYIHKGFKAFIKDEVFEPEKVTEEDFEIMMRDIFNELFTCRPVVANYDEDLQMNEIYTEVLETHNFEFNVYD